LPANKNILFLAVDSKVSIQYQAHLERMSDYLGMGREFGGTVMNMGLSSLTLGVLQLLAVGNLPLHQPNTNQCWHT